MDILFSGSAKRTLHKMVNKGLLKKEDLDTPPDGWFLAMGYEREIGTGKWKRIQKTKYGARPSMPTNNLPIYKNILTVKITFDPVING